MTMTPRKFSIIVFAFVVILNAVAWFGLPLYVGDKWVAEISNIEEFNDDDSMNMDDLRTADVKLRFVYGICWKEIEIKGVKSWNTWYAKEGDELVDLSWQKKSAISDAWEAKFGESAKRDAKNRKSILEKISK